ncbi:hypothetical protein CVT25_000142 [Psilocybe cyanescens]|uniref:Uncharacterized protein n=1 Tax=Psilocybe cyanescens TaxID=93625 RepID=A0A409VVN2_PSICY|nr:hypothetical protein CVT25_000142 [Psilocybe cyanescens]
MTRSCLIFNANGRSYNRSMMRTISVQYRSTYARDPLLFIIITTMSSMRINRSPLAFKVQICPKYQQWGYGIWATDTFARLPAATIELT